MGAWGTSLDPTGKSGIRFLADPHGELTSALDLSFDGAAIFGNARSKRYALVVENGKITQTHVEPDNTGLDGMLCLTSSAPAGACRIPGTLFANDHVFTQSALPRRSLEVLKSCKQENLEQSFLANEWKVRSIHIHVQHFLCHMEHCRKVKIMQIDFCELSVICRRPRGLHYLPSCAMALGALLGSTHV